MSEQRLISFLKSVRDVAWFSHAGEPFENARVVHGMQIAWDREGNRMFEVWEQQIRALEAQAVESIGNQGIDEIFAAVSETIHASIYQGLTLYLDRIYREAHDEKQRRQRTFDDAVYPEVMDSVKRDLCWAGVEYVLQVHGFFSKLLEMYRQGRWICSWDGDYPQGQPVIL